MVRKKGSVVRSGAAAKRPSAAAKRARGSGASGVYDALRRDILGLAMEPGTLLDESDLAARFKLSRSPVREALIRLAAEGLVHTLRNRSSIVAPFDVAAIPSYLDSVELMYRLTTRLAAMNRKASQLSRIQELQREHAAAIQREDGFAMIRLNHEFHEAIAAASGNTVYLNWTRQVLDQGQRILGMYLHDVGDTIATHVVSHHAAMVRAIEKQDPDAAEAAARQDADIIADRMKERFESRPSGGLTLGARKAK
jgi:DNA-binding GntR family transcriptional regulator